MIYLVRSGRSPDELAKEFEPSGQTFRNWGIPLATAFLISAFTRVSASFSENPVSCAIFMAFPVKSFTATLGGTGCVSML